MAVGTPPNAMLSALHRTCTLVRGRNISICLAWLLCGQPVGGELTAQGRSTDAIAQQPSESVAIPDNLAAYIEFCDSLKPGSTYRQQVRPWTAAEKKVVIDRLSSILARAKGLLVRAAQFGPVALYRTAGDVQFSAASYVIYGNGDANQEVLFSDPYFQSNLSPLCEKKVERSLRTTAHELGHLADVGSKIVCSRRWAELMGDAIRSGTEMSPDLARWPEGHYHQKGVPTAYATTNLGEALAECAAAIALTDKPCVRPEVEDFLRTKLFHLPFTPDPSIRLNYDAHRLLREGKLEQSRAAFDQALKIDPDYTEAQWGLKLLEMIASERQKAPTPSATPHTNSP